MPPGEPSVPEPRLPSQGAGDLAPDRPATTPHPLVRASHHQPLVRFVSTMKAKYLLLTAFAALALTFAATPAQAQGAYYYSQGYHHYRSFHHHHHYGYYHHHRGWHRGGPTTVIVTP